MTLTATLREQHLQLHALLEELRRRGIASAEGRELLQKTRAAVLSHLSLEDSRLYPALRAYPATSGLARRYAREMHQLTPAVVAFFDAYRDGSADPQGFTRSLVQLLAVLQQRIRREEDTLYPAYDEHCSAS